jgi:hypothetical protein
LSFIILLCDRTFLTKLALAFCNFFALVDKELVFESSLLFELFWVASFFFPSPSEPLLSMDDCVGDRAREALFVIDEGSLQLSLLPDASELSLSWSDLLVASTLNTFKGKVESEPVTLPQSHFLHQLLLVA